MKNRDQANNNNRLNDPTVDNDLQGQVEFNDLPISGEQEELVKGGTGKTFLRFKFDTVFTTKIDS